MPSNKKIARQNNFPQVKLSITFTVKTLLILDFISYILLSFSFLRESSVVLDNLVSYLEDPLFYYANIILALITIFFFIQTLLKPAKVTVKLLSVVMVILSIFVLLCYSFTVFMYHSMVS